MFFSTVTISSDSETEQISETTNHISIYITWWCRRIYLDYCLYCCTRGWDVHAAFPQTDRTVSLIGDFEAKKVHYHRLEISEVDERELETPRRHFLRLGRTISLLLNIKPDVVHINLPSPVQCFGSILACALLGIPTAVVFQLAPIPVSFSHKKLKVYAWARYNKQQWITVSENNRKCICKSFQIPYDRVLRIYNGTKVTPDSNICDRENITGLRRQLRQELGVPETTRIALTVGRLHPQKGYSDFIPVIPEIVREFPEVKFAWVGDGEQRDYLLRKLREYNVEDRVLLLGYRSDVPRLLKSADLFVFPTHYEGQSFALLEAMAHGLPIVTSDASGIPEIVEDKVHALMFRTGEVCDLLEVIRWALRHPDDMQKMGQKAAVHVQSFSEEKMVKETLGVFNRLVKL